MLALDLWQISAAKTRIHAGLRAIDRMSRADGSFLRSQAIQPRWVALLNSVLGKGRAGDGTTSLSLIYRPTSSMAASPTVDLPVATVGVSRPWRPFVLGPQPLRYATLLVASLCNVVATTRQIAERSPGAGRRRRPQVAASVPRPTPALSRPDPRVRASSLRSVAGRRPIRRDGDGNGEHDDGRGGRDPHPRCMADEYEAVGSELAEAGDGRITEPHEGKGRF